MIKTTARVFYFSFLIFISIYFSKVASAGYGPGFTSGWIPAHDGLTGYMYGYKSPSDFYTTGSTITVKAHIVNPQDNNITIHGKRIYVAVNKISESPVGNNVDNGYPAISEGVLYTNNLAGDSQVLISSSFLQSVNLNPGKSIDITYNFIENDKGYYQVDFSDTNFSSGYTPGSILASGFVRVIKKDEDDHDKKHEDDKHKDNNRERNDDNVLGASSHRDDNNFKNKYWESFVNFCRHIKLM